MNNQQNRKRELRESVRAFKVGMLKDAKRTAVLPEDEVIEQKQKGNVRSKELGGFKRYRSIGDGNCSFRSYSQGMVGHQNLHKPFRMGTAAMMMLYPDRYKPAKMSFRDYLHYVRIVVSRDRESVRSYVAEAASDLLQARLVRTYSKGSRLIGEMIPEEGPIAYEINLINHPGHVDTLGRQHIYSHRRLIRESDEGAWTRKEDDVESLMGL